MYIYLAKTTASPPTKEPKNEDERKMRDEL